MRLNYRHLYYFWRVATEGNLTAVAKKLHVSQSALSSQIRQLEESTETQLFDRSGRRMTLTDAGQRVLGYANDIFAKGEELESMLRHGMEPEAQMLRIGMLSTLSRNFIDHLVTPLLIDRKIRFTLHANTLDGLLDGLARHQLDVALTNGDVRGSDEQLWQSQLLASQPVSIVGPPELRPETTFPHGYEGKYWVLPSRDSEVRRAFDGLCTLWQYAPDVQAEADDMAMLRLLARDGDALAVLPTVVVRDEIRRGQLVEYMTLPNVFEYFYAITIRRSYVPTALQTLLVDIGRVE